MFIINFAQAPATLVTRSISHPTDLETWHHQFAHIGEETIHKMIRGEMVNGLTVTKFRVTGRCKDYILGKQSRRPFDMDVEPECAPYERIAFNIWGPAWIQTIGRQTMMLVATDQDGAECTTWYLSSKTAETTLSCLEAFDVHAKTQWRKQVKYV